MPRRETNKGAVYSHTNTVRHGMRAAIVVRHGSLGVAVASTACAPGEDGSDRPRRGTRPGCGKPSVASELTCRVDAMGLMYACGPLRASLHGCGNRPSSALRWDCSATACAKRSREARALQRTSPWRARRQRRLCSVAGPRCPDCSCFCCLSKKSKSRWCSNPQRESPHDCCRTALSSAGARPRGTGALIPAHR